MARRTSIGTAGRIPTVGPLAMGWVLAAALGCSESGTSDEGDDATIEKVSEALTRDVDFEGGVVRDGDLPTADAPEVTLVPLEPTLLMAPGAAGIMALNSDNPDEDSDPVAATLLQFDKSGRHIEVSRAEPRAEPTADIENTFTVSADICEKLGKGKFSIGIRSALKTRSGKIGRHHEHKAELNCDGGDTEGAGGTGGSVAMSGRGGEGGTGGGSDTGGDFGGDPEWVGTWDVTLTLDDESLDCVVDIADNLQFTVTCDEGPETDYELDCDRTHNMMRITGSFGRDAGAMLLGGIERFSGPGCASFDIVTDVDIEETELDAEATRTTAGLGTLGGEWSVDLFDWGCPDALETCDNSLRARSYQELDATLSIDDSGAIHVSGIQLPAPGEPTDCEYAFEVSGDIGAGSVDLTLTESREGVDCGTGDTVTIVGTRR